MNISLTTPLDTPGNESLQDDLDQHREIMVNAGYEILNSHPVLIPDPEYPGAYQVWWRAKWKSQMVMFLHVTPDGVAVWSDADALLDTQ